MELRESVGFAAAAAAAAVAAFPWAMLQRYRLTVFFLASLPLFLFTQSKCTKVIRFTLMIYSVYYVGSFIICAPHADDMQAPPAVHWKCNH